MERNRLIIPRDVISMKKIYKVYILKFLSDGSKVYGLEIKDRVKEHFKDNVFKVSHTTIYGTLHLLEEEGYLISTWDSEVSVLNRGKRYYRITDAGIKYFKHIELETISALEKNKNLVDKLIDLLN